MSAAAVTTASPRPEHRAGPREWLGLVLLLLPMLTVASDLTVLFLAMPILTADLQPTATQALWIVHVYGFLIAGFLLTMGRLGDRVGPRRLLLVGSLAFGGLSLVAAFAPGAGALIAARALLGVAGATLMPSLFSLLRVMFHDDAQRRLAIAVIMSGFSVGGAIGPLLGGLLLEHFWWGSVFLMNVPPMLLLVLVGPRVLPERRERDLSPLDPASVLLSVSGMLGVVYGLQELAAGQESGEGALGPALMVSAVGAGLLVLFVRRQRRLRLPLLDLAMLADRRMAVPLATILLVGIAMVGTFYLFTQHLQWVEGHSPLEAGLWTLPYIVLNIASAMLSPALARRVRPAVVVTSGLVVATLGTVGIALASSFPALLVGISVLGLGQGAAFALVSDLIISSAPAARAGSAAAAQEVSGELGSALGIAAGGAIGTVVYRGALESSMPSTVAGDTAQSATESIHSGVAAAESGPGGSGLLDAVHDAITLGLQTYAGAGAALIGLSAALVGVLLVSRAPNGASARAGVIEDSREPTG